MQKLVDLLTPEVKNGRMKAFCTYFLDKAKAEQVKEENAAKAQGESIH
jgi:hypothetical protein